MNCIIFTTTRAIAHSSFYFSKKIQQVVACHDDIPAHDLSEIKSMFEDADSVRDGGAEDSIDYLVCPDSTPASRLPRDRRNIRSVSLEWVITALRVNELIDPNQSPLFRPLEHNVSSGQQFSLWHSHLPNK